GDDPDSREPLQAAAAAAADIWIASVAGEEAETQLNALLAECATATPWYARTQGRTGPLTNSYTEPQRMGVDRWLAMLGAWQRQPGPLCVVDAGSALTIDLVDAAGLHEGGYIIPGPTLMERALLLDTDRVRFHENEDYELSPGRSTAAAVRHGIALAQAGAVRLVLQRSGAARPTLVFSGGAGEVLLGLVDEGGQYVSDLVFEGLEAMRALS
ncbi:MAG: type III pantothenate kinase, partial [Halioglobus sp.]|nr:type III pantothenate kinase [Halioglobus sp.]